MVNNSKIIFYDANESEKKAEYLRFDKNIYIDKKAKDTLYLIKHKFKEILRTPIIESDSVRYNVAIEKHPKITDYKLQVKDLLNKLWKVKDKSHLFRAKFIKFNTDNTAILYSKNKEKLSKVKWNLNYLLGGNYLIFTENEIFKFAIIITKINKNTIEGKVWNKGSLKKIKFNAL